MIHVIRRLGCLCALLALAPGAQADPQFEALGHLGGGETLFADLSSDGSTVVGTSRVEAGGSRRAFHWRAASGMVELDIVSDAVIVNGVSADGEVIAGRINSSNARGYVWTEADGASDIGQLPNHRNLVQPSSISGDGRTIVGYSWTTDGTEPFLYEEEFGMHVIPGLGNFVNHLRVSQDGTRVAGNKGTSSVRNLFVWTRLGRATDDGLVGTVTDLGDLPGGQTFGTPWAISSDGSTVVGDSLGAAGREAFVWSGEHGLLGLGRLRGIGAPGTSRAQGVTGDGAMVVGHSWEGHSFDPDVVELFVWTAESGMRPLVEIFAQEFGLADALAGWRFTRVDVSDDGLTFAGEGYNPAGAREAWRVVLDRLIPPPDVPMDLDEDGIPNILDNCPETFNPEQQDRDGDGVGDACNEAFDLDGDDWADELDNCPDAENGDQAESDGDGLGDACDPFPDDPDNEFAQLQLDLELARAERDALSNELGVCLAEPRFLDQDGDGEDDSTDWCLASPPGEPVDTAGCTVAEFCAAQPLKACSSADWGNDEPRKTPWDCALTIATAEAPKACVEASAGPKDPPKPPVATKPDCGLGPELAVVLPLLTALRARRRRV